MMSSGRAAAIAAITSAAVLAGFSRPPSVAAATLSPAQTAAIDAGATAELARDHTPGAALAVARNGVVLYSRGYGFRDAASKLPTDAATVFAIGSVTKQFTAAGVMKLVEAGKVRLDVPIARYLADIPSGDKITVRELLNQTSGLANYTDADGFEELSAGPTTPAKIVASIAAKPLAFEPGSRWAYSNTNYVILGMLIEKIAGVPYGRYIAERICTPLELWKTRYSSTYLETGDVAFPYGAGVRNAAASRLVATNLDWAYAAGALWSNATDLVRWEDALNSGRVVDAASLASMTTPGTTTSGASTGYGFGLEVTDLYGEREIWHTGGLPGYASIVAYFPSEHLEIAVLGNTIAFNASPIVRSALAAIVPSVAAKIAAEADATPSPGEDPAMTKLATSLVSQAQTGAVDRTLMNAAMSAALTNEMVASVARQLAPLGAPKNVIFLRKVESGGYRSYRYRIVWDSLALDESFAFDGDGKIAGWFFKPASDSTPAPAPATASPSPSP